MRLQHPAREAIEQELPAFLNNIGWPEDWTSWSLSRPRCPLTSAIIRVALGPPEVTGDDVVAAKDAVGVDGALLVSPFTMYRYDANYPIQVHAAHPGRFG